MKKTNIFDFKSLYSSHSNQHQYQYTGHPIAKELQHHLYQIQAWMHECSLLPSANNCCRQYEEKSIPRRKPPTIPLVPHNESSDWIESTTSVGQQLDASTAPSCSSRESDSEGELLTIELNEWKGYESIWRTTNPSNLFTTLQISSMETTNTAMSCAERAGKLGPSSPFSSLFFSTTCSSTVSYTHLRAHET